MNRRNLIAGAAALCAMAALPTEAAPTVTHPDGKVFVRIDDHWMPL